MESLIKSQRLILGSRTRAAFILSHSEGSLPVTSLPLDPALHPAPRLPVLLPRLSRCPRDFRAVRVRVGCRGGAKRHGLRTDRLTVPHEGRGGPLPVDSVGSSQRTKLVPVQDSARHQQGRPCPPALAMPTRDLDKEGGSGRGHGSVYNVSDWQEKPKLRTQTVVVFQLASDQ